MLKVCPIFSGFIRRLLFIMALPFMALPATAVEALPDTCLKVRMEVRRLPDLNVPRSGHALLCVNGEVTVVGGHT